MTLTRLAVLAGALVLAWAADGSLIAYTYPGEPVSRWVLFCRNAAFFVAAVVAAKIIWALV